MSRPTRIEALMSLVTSIRKVKVEAHRINDEDYTQAGKESVEALWDADSWMTEWIDQEKGKSNV